MLPVTVLLSLFPFVFAAPKPWPVAHLNPRFKPPPKPSQIAQHYPAAPTGTGSATGCGTWAKLSTSLWANDCGSPSKGRNDLPFSIVVPNGQHNSDIHAVNGSFWTGRKQGSVCPKSVGNECAKDNSTKTLLKLEGGALSLVSSGRPICLRGYSRLTSPVVCCSPWRSGRLGRFRGRTLFPRGTKSCHPTRGRDYRLYWCWWSRLWNAKVPVHGLHALHRY